MSKTPPVDAPSDDWLVHADELQKSGDPRGELIVLNHALHTGQATDTSARDAFVKKNADVLLGSKVAKLIDRVKIDWRWIYVDRAEVVANQSSEASLVAALLDAPAAAELSSLVVSGDPNGGDVDLTPAFDRIKTSGLPVSCTSLSFVDQKAARSTSVIATFYDPPVNKVAFGSLDPLWPRFEALKRLHISVNDGAQVDYGTIRAPSLEHFQVDCLTWGGHGDLPLALAEAEWPNLKHFEIRLPEHWTHSIADAEDAYTRPYEDREDDEDYYGDDDGYHDGFDWRGALAPLLESLLKTKLERLGLTSFESVDNVLATLEDVTLPDTLKVLDLSDSSIRSAKWFVDHKDIVGRLEKIVLNRTPMAGRDLEQLRELGVEVEHSPGHGATYRFLVGME